LDKGEGITYSGLRIGTTENTEFDFVVDQRSKWIDRLKVCMKNCRKYLPQVHKMEDEFTVCRPAKSRLRRRTTEAVQKVLLATARL